MLRLKMLPSVLLSMLCFSSIAAAQADCPAIVTAALNTATEACTGLQRNQVCYGNVTLIATARAGVSVWDFEQAGDIANVSDLDSLQLSSMSLTDETWGVALMQLQANLPDTLPGQNVTVLLFGNVEITNPDAASTAFDVMATAHINVRLRPTTGESNIISSLESGQVVSATGRLADSSWIRIVLDADTGDSGWVSAEYLSTDADLETLPVTAAGTELLSPLQAFYFTSGVGDRPCSEAPDSGILIQTPQGVGEMSLLINEVEIRLGSTIYMQAGNGTMRVSVVEGHATLTSNGVTQTVPAGTYSEMSLDSDGMVNGAPTFPQPYNYDDLLALPVSVALPQVVSVAPALQGSQVQGSIDLTNGLPPSGHWAMVGSVTEVVETSCPQGAVNPDVGSDWSASLTLRFNADRSTLSWTSGGATRTLTQFDADTYYEGGGPNVTFTSTTTFTAHGGSSWWNENCYSSWTTSGTYVP